MFNDDDEEDLRTYEVVMNHEEQYSIWPQSKPVPGGWIIVGKTGLKAECLAYIEEAWTDMRPLSLRKHMEAYEAQRNGVAIPPSAIGVLGTAMTDESAATETN